MASMDRFGDLSGLVWNERSGHLIAGHQRLVALQNEYGNALRIEKDALVTPDGERFPIRRVQWDEDTAKLANIAANNPLLAGTFTPEVEDLIGEVGVGVDVLEALRLDELVGGLKPPKPERVSTKQPIKVACVLCILPATEYERAAGPLRELAAIKGAIVQTNIQ